MVTESRYILILFYSDALLICETGDLLEKLDKTAAETLAGAENENGESDLDQDAIESATDSEQSATTVAYDPPGSIPNGNSTTPKHQDSRLLGSTLPILPLPLMLWRHSNNPDISTVRLRASRMKSKHFKDS